MTKHMKIMCKTNVYNCFLTEIPMPKFMFLSFCVLDLFGLRFYVPVNSYGHVETVSSPNHIFFLGKLDLAVNQYFDRAGIKLMTPGSAVGLAIDYATGSGFRFKQCVDHQHYH